MKQRELVAALAEASGESKAACARVLDGLAPAVRAALIQGKSATLPGVGKIKLIQRAARIVTSPQGLAVHVPAGPAVKFSPAKALKTALATDEAPEGLA